MSNKLGGVRRNSVLNSTFVVRHAIARSKGTVRRSVWVANFEFSEIVLCWNIEQRNRLRAQAGLSLLNPVVESKRLDAVIEQAEFEREWQRRRPEFAHQWISNNNGWLTNAARWALARQQVRREISGED